MSSCSYPVIMLITMCFDHVSSVPHILHISVTGYVRIPNFVIWLLILMLFLVSNWWSIMHVSSPYKGPLHWALAWSLCTAARSLRAPGAGPFVNSGTKRSLKLMGISVSEHGHCQIWFNNWLYYSEWLRQNGPWSFYFMPGCSPQVSGY